MIRVQKNYADVPAGLTTDGAKNKINKALEERNEHKASPYYYASGSVKEALLDIYHGKCAYCETPQSPGWAWRVEHYRPRRPPREANNDHPGYYWLTYEWSNLLLSCETCNGKKSNRFPVQEDRVATPPNGRGQWRADSGTLLAEKPLLLNPELDNPADHIVFEPDGSIKEKGGDDRGKETIRICDLDRENLKLARKKMVDKFRNKIKGQVDRLYTLLKIGTIATDDHYRVALELAFENVFKHLLASSNPDKPYSQLGWHMVNDFENFILESIPAGNQREVVSLAFQNATKVFYSPEI